MANSVLITFVDEECFITCDLIPVVIGFDVYR